jgi:hypothetical protein
MGIRDGPEIFSSIFIVGHILSEREPTDNLVITENVIIFLCQAKTDKLRISG